jgi:hypothetical protein
MTELEEAKRRLRLVESQMAELEQMRAQLRERIRALETLPPLPHVPKIGPYSGREAGEVFAEILRENGPVPRERLIELGLDGGLRFGTAKSSPGQVRGYASRSIDGLVAMKRLVESEGLISLP